jgi:fibronectin-binding autotransporter adhesin
MMNTFKKADTGTRVQNVIQPFVILLCLFITFFNEVHAQANFTSAAVGPNNWNTAATWTQTGVDADGIPDGNDNVTIANGHTVNLNNALPSLLIPACASLSINGSGVLNFPTGLMVLTVNGALTLNGTSQITITGGAGARTLNANSLSVGAAATNARISSITMTINGASTIDGTLVLNSDTGVKTFIGAVTNSGSWTSTAITTPGNLVFRNGATTSGSNFAAAVATFNTTGGQLIGGSTAMSFSGAVSVATDVTLTGGGTLSFANTVTLTGAGTEVTNDKTNTVTLSNTGAAILTGTAGATWTQGANSTLSYAGSTITTITLNAAVPANTPNTVIYTGATATIFPASYNNLTYSGTTTGTVATGTTVNISGNLTASSGTFTAAGTGTVAFNGSATQTISGAGTFNFVNLTVAGTAGNVNVDKSILINGGANALTFSANRLLNVNATSNITLGATTTISGANTTRYIQLDGSPGSASQLIKTTTTTASTWQILFPIGTNTGGYTPLDLSTGTTLTNPGNGSLSVKAIYNNSIQGQLRRSFRLVSVSSLATTFSGGRFYINSTADVSGGDALANYTQYWYLNNTGGSWSSLVGTINNSPGGNFPVNPPGYYFSTTTANQALSTGTYYYTMGSSTAYPNTWYSYQSGVWSNWENWTLDPSGITLANGLQLPPQPGDAIVILNGLIITNDANSRSASSTTISSGGTLDMAATTGNTLGTVSGSGLLRLNGVALPTGTYTSFVTTSGGTIEYYNAVGTVDATQTSTYNNLIFSNSSTSTDASFITASNTLVVNGNLNVTQTGAGRTVTWQVNNGTGTQRTITVTGDVTVSANGRIRVGTGNSGTPHNLTLNGNFTNNGSVRFFDDTGTINDTNYNSGSVYSLATAGNAVNATFSGLASKTLICNGQTDFYRLILDKGTGQQALLTVNSTAASNLRLYGPNNLTSAPIPNVATTASLNALRIVNGTLELTGTLTIPRLTSEGGAAGNNYLCIPQNGGLWINSPNVTITVAQPSGCDDCRILVNGLLKISSGRLISGFGRGLGAGTGGTFIVEGGTVETWQYRPLSGSQDVVYIQTGGKVYVGTTGWNQTPVITGTVDAISNGYARFDLPSVTSTFQMSSGELHIGTPTSLVDAGGLNIDSDASKISVTGGDINAYIPATGTSDFGISSTAPIYNLKIWKESAGSTRVAEIGLDINIKNDLVLASLNAPSLYFNSNDLTIGGNLTDSTGTNIYSGTVATPNGTHSITINGSGNQLWTHSGTINELETMIMAKSGGTLTLGGSSTFPNITTNLTLTSGTLNDGGKVLTVTGATVSNSTTHVTSIATGAIVINGATAIAGGGGTFGNLRITTNGPVTTAGDYTVTNDLRLTAANSTLNIQSYALTVLGGIYDAATGTSTAGLGTNKRIQTAGLRNDGGLTRQGAAGDLLFPVGVAAPSTYTPSIINVAASTHGQITVRPVVGIHPNLPAASVGQSLGFYFRLTSTGYAGVTTVTHKSYTYGTNTLINGTAANYRVARYDPVLFSWTSAFPHTASGTIIYPGTLNFSFGVNIDGEYTSGNIATVLVTTYYSRLSGSWTTATNWSTLANRSNIAGSAPCNTCPVVIGDGATNNHSMSIPANGITAGSLLIYSGSTLDCSTYTGLDFGVYTNPSSVANGTLKISAVTAGFGVFPAGDFTNFIGPAGGTVEWYGAAKTLPTTSPDNIILDNYNNVKINPTPGQTITLPSSNLTIYGDLTVNDDGDGGTVQTNNAVSRIFTLNGNFSVSNGTFNILTNAGNTVTSTFNLSNSLKSLTVASGATLSVSGGTATHSLTTYGNIVNNGTINFRNGSAVNLTFKGTTNNSFTGTNAGAATTLSFVTLDKGVDQSATLTMDFLGTMPTAPPNIWLSLLNGTFAFGNSLTYTIQANAATYSIPSTAKLKVQLGTVNILSNGSNAADLLLNGGLEVSGGTAVVGSAGGDFNNDIEYASSGLPSITVSGTGTLNVNGAIRRATSTLSGALVFNQTGGTLNVRGRNCDANNTRGVFEIESNSGSAFNMSSGTLNVERSTSGAAYADLYINPASSSVTGGTIQIGMSTNTSVTTPLSVNIAPAVFNFSVLGNGTTAQVVDMRSSALTTSGTLTINSNSTLETNALNVNIGGDLTISSTAPIGVYNGTISGGNTTTFNGTGAQAGTLTSGSTFQNITINKTSGTATLSGNSTINNLSILSGTLSVTNTLDINGDIINNSIQTGAGTLNIAGTSATHAITSSNGTFGNLSLGGSSTTKTVTVSGNMSITGLFDFTTSGTSRYLNIGSNKLTFSQAASNIANAGAARFIKTNGVASDLGVVKNWAAAAARTFVYAVGTRTNYTPVSMTLTVTSPGSFTVVPVDDQHPTASALGEQILNYYWIVNRGSGLVYSNTGSHSYQFPSALIGGSGGTLVAAHLDAIKLVGWTTAGHGGTTTTTLMTFTNLLNTNLPGTGGVNPEVEFHYTAGTSTTLPNPVTPVYSRMDLPATVGNTSVGGDWTLASNWTTSSTGIGGTVQQVYPSGRPVVILGTTRINMNVVGMRAFTTGIDGLLVMTTTAGHSLGVISGTGTLRATSSTLPVGNYTSFVSAAGGTIEYNPSPAVDINMNIRDTYNNVSIVGSNIVSIPNLTSLTLNGSLNVSAGATLSNTSFNKNISIAGNIVNAGTILHGTGAVDLVGNFTNSGTYTQSSGTLNVGGNWSNTGTHDVGTGTVNFNSAIAQGISGTNSFYNLSVSKSAGNVTLNASTTVTNLLTLTNGSIITTAANPLVLTTAASSTAGNANSFVSGPMLKTFNGSFTFPVGSTTANRYRPATISATSASNTWTVEYIGNNPSNAPQNYYNTSFNTAAPASLGKVSQFEYWNVSRPGATTAALELTYNTGSYVVNPTNIGTVANLKVVRWDGTKWDVPPGSGTFTQTGTNVTGTVKVSIVSTFSPFTFGSTDPDSPLPITLLSFNAKLNNDRVDLTWKTSQEIGNHYFIVEKTRDLESFTEVGKVDGHGDSKEEHKYSMVDSEPYYGKSYYRLKQVDFDGNFTYSEVKIIDYSGPTFATLRAYPNPLGVNNDNSELYIEVLGLKDTQIVPLKMYNLQGQIIFERVYEVTNPGYLKEKVDLPNRPGPGIYILKAGSTLHLTRKIVIE